MNLLQAEITQQRNLFGAKTLVSCFSNLLQTSVKGAFINQPNLTNLDASQLPIAKQAPKVLQTIAAV